MIDIHGHPGELTSAESIARVVGAMDTLNIQVLVDANGTSPAGD